MNKIALGSAIYLSKVLKMNYPKNSHTVILGFDEDSASITFYRDRFDQSYIDANELEDFDQPLLLINF